jgi:peptidoglycan hydrolase-like protein with peptidoglycan-binding domain
MNFNIKVTLISLVAILSFSITGDVYATSVGETINFNVDKSFDINSRTQITATLVRVSPKLYFYVEKPWWDSQTPLKQSQINANLDSLSNEFDNNIYPKLTSIFGSEWNPGIDNDSRITVLLEPINNTEGGYFREADGYKKIQMPISNEREMVYISLANIDSDKMKVVLAHEFMHLITFNQKNKILGIEEDTWLNEARADYSSTILGYDNLYEGSNLQKRVNDFLENPSDSLTNWTGAKYDYASVSLFTNYLVDHYGQNILSDSLRSKSAGVDSINLALLKDDAKVNFSQIFTNWTTTSILNDCTQNSLYCYLSPNLKNIKINPSLIFLPLTGNISLSSRNIAKSWAGNWQKIIGGNGSVKLKFSNLSDSDFRVPYIIYDKNNNYSVNSLQFSQGKDAEINIQNFGTIYKSLIIIPSLQNKDSGLDGEDLNYYYSFGVSINEDKPIEKLINNSNSCSNLNYDLYVGLSNNNVKCLQQFLKNQGAEIYPEGLVTGYFGPLTMKAVTKFQEKYAFEILSPIKLFRGTGYVGIQTRTKINKMISSI